jgi:flagellar basal body-associated protein FliL
MQARHALLIVVTVLALLAGGCQPSQMASQPAEQRLSAPAPEQSQQSHDPWVYYNLWADIY